MSPASTDAEPHWQIMWLTLCHCYDSYGGISYETAMQVALDIVTRTGMSMSQDHMKKLFSENAGITADIG